MVLNSLFGYIYWYMVFPIHAQWDLNLATVGVIGVSESQLILPGISFISAHNGGLSYGTQTLLLGNMVNIEYKLSAAGLVYVTCQGTKVSLELIVNSNITSSSINTYAITIPLSTDTMPCL